MREEQRTRIIDLIEQQMQNQRDRKIANQAAAPYQMWLFIILGTLGWYFDLGAIFGFDSGYFCLGGFAMALIAWFMSKITGGGPKF